VDAGERVGIGGAYLCIYGMEGPGRLPARRPHGAGLEPAPARDRTSPSRGCSDRSTSCGGTSWRRTSCWTCAPSRRRGRCPLRIDESHFRLADHQRALAAHAEDIDRFTRRQRAAFAAERLAWADAGELERAGG
jgi:urea carboxylase